MGRPAVALKRRQSEDAIQATSHQQHGADDRHADDADAEREHGGGAQADADLRSEPASERKAMPKIGEDEQEDGGK